MKLGVYRAVAVVAVVVSLAGMLGGCARPTGDFGRAAPSVLHDRIMPEMGAARAAADGEPVSTFNLTDQEREMHDRVWRFLVAPHAHDWFYDTAVELQRTRLASNLDQQFVSNRYYRYISTAAYQSSRVRYKKVANDIVIDLATLPATFKSICDVIEVDRQRAIAVRHAGALPANAEQQVAARKWENDQKIGWFTRALSYRYNSYATALDRLLVETPHEEARIVDAKLEELDIYIRRAQAGQFCPGMGGAPVYKDSVVASRYATQPFSTERTYRK